MFYCASTVSKDSSPKAEPQEQRGLTLNMLASRLRKQKQSLTHIWLHATLLATSFPQCYVTIFTLRFFKFYLSLLCHPFPPATLSEHRLVCFFSGPSACYIISPLCCSYPPRVKEHHLDLEVCISIASLHLQPFSFL
jgi:hypothetical protein